MEQKINVGIVGYGNLGRGVEMAVRQNPDFELVAIFTRRPPEQVKADAQVVHISQPEDYRRKLMLRSCAEVHTDHWNRAQLQEFLIQWTALITMKGFQNILHQLMRQPERGVKSA